MLFKIHKALKDYTDVGNAIQFFRSLGYETLSEPLPFSEADQLPQSARGLIESFYLISDYRPPQLESPTSSQFRIYHVELKTQTLRRTDFRRIIEPFYRRFPQGNNLFVFTLHRQPYSEIAFVSPHRLLLPRGRVSDEWKVTVRLRTLRVMREEPYHTDLEILSEIANPPSEPEAIWQKHLTAFNIERVTKQFFDEYREALYAMMGAIKCNQPEPEDKEKVRARRFAFSQLLLNRLMVCYFLARKSWMRDDKGQPLRRYFRWLWMQYRDERERNHKASFHNWLQVLFNYAFNNQLSKVQSSPLPKEVRDSFLTMPYLNGGLFLPSEPDEYGYTVPDEVFENWLFGKDPDSDPKLLERYNFTVDESRPYDEEVAVDPEMLGKVYESLIAEEERGEAGIFYTPRLEVDLMCRLSIAEYLHQQWNFDRKKVLEFVFSPFDLSTLRKFTDAEKRAMERALKSCKIVDPAVGSGSFLVGMLNVLCELLDALAESLERKKYDRFELKRQLILNNLYGVDVKDWAVRVCELRLFLSLLVDLPDGLVLKEAEKAEPILPNLDFRVRFGDSIVQEVPGLTVPLILRKLGGALLPIQKKLRQLAEKKAELTKIPPKDLARKEQEVWEEERKIIAELLEIASKNVKDRNQHEQIQKQREKLLKGEPIPLFLWEVAFPEVFFAGNGNGQGFDIVIMNPPYVRHEKIAPPTPLSPKDYRTAVARNIDYLWALNWSLDPKDLRKDNAVNVPGRADLYVPFFFVGTALLKPKGVLCLVTSNSWLDVDYGKAVQKFLLCKTKWVMTIDNFAKRTFAQSDINTVITLSVRPDECESVWDSEVRFVAFRVPFDELSPELFAVAFEEIFETKERTQKPDYRVTLKTQRELYLEGVEEPEEGKQAQQTLEVEDLSQLEYVGNKIGGKYLRAPDIFFTILEKGKGKLVRLGDIAEVRRGFTTGANEFFYLEPVGRSVKEVAELREKDPKAPVRVRNGAGWEGEIEATFLAPLLFSLKEAPSLRLDLGNLRRCVFLCQKDHAALKTEGFKHALAYIETFERHKVRLKFGGECSLPQVPSLRGRNPWYALPKQRMPDFISNRFLGERFAFIEGGKALVCDVFFVGYVRNPAEKLCVVAALNATPTALLAEILARKTYGIGVAYLYGPEVNSLLVLNPSVLSPRQRKSLLSAFDRLSCRPIRSIFEELGFALCSVRRCPHPEHPYEHVRPEALTLEQVKQASPDRFELDSVIFDALGLTDEERLQVYQAVAELVKIRLVRARIHEA